MPFVALQQLIDEANHFGLFAYDKALYIGELSGLCQFRCGAGRPRIGI